MIQKSIPNSLKKKWCNICKRFLALDNFGVANSKKDGLKANCKQCNAESAVEYHQNNKEERNEYSKNHREKNMFKIRMRDARQRAKKKNISIDINDSYLEELFDLQKGLCYYSGIPMNIERVENLENGEKDNYSISVDRIDSSKGYTKDNIVLSCWIVNRMKGDLSVEEFGSVINNLYNNLPN